MISQYHEIWPIKHIQFPKNPFFKHSVNPKRLFIKIMLRFPFNDPHVWHRVQPQFDSKIGTRKPRD